MPDESLAKAMILISKESMLDCLTLLDRLETLTFAEVRDMVTVGVWDMDVQRGLLELLRNADEKGTLLPSEIPNLEIELRQAISASFHVADKLGGLTGIGSMVFKRPALLQWKVLNPAILSMNFTTGQFGYIAGVPRSGKTNLGCVWMEGYTASGGVVITNILLKNPPSNYYYASTVSDLLKTVSHLPVGQRWTVMIDEGGLWVSTKDSMTTRGKALDKLAKVIGKLDGNLLVIDQQESTVPTVVKAFAANHFYTIRPGDVRIDLKGPSVYFSDTVTDFPKTQLEFDTFDISLFTFGKVNLDVLFQAMTGKQGTQAKAAMSDYFVKSL